MIIQQIKQRIAELHKQVAEIQDNCSHPHAAVNCVAKSSTGGYDPSTDVYWYEFHCQLCDKQWSTMQ